MKEFILCVLACLAVELCLGRQECAKAPENCVIKDNEDYGAAIMPADTENPQKYFYVGGMFGVHHAGPTGYTRGKIRERGLQNMEMFFYALDTFRDRLSNDPTVKVGGIAFDSGSRESQTVENLLGFETCKVAYGKFNTSTNTSARVDPRYVLAYVGPDRSGEVMQTALVLKDMNKTQVSYANSALLENKQLYSYLLRTMPSSSNEVKAMVEIMEMKKWKYVIAVYSNTAYGKGLLMSLKKATEVKGICVVSEYMIPTQYTPGDLNAIIDNLTTKKVAYVVAVLMEDSYATALMNEFGNTANVRGSFVFLGTNSWNNNPTVTSGAGGAANGAITLAGRLDSYQVHVADFKRFFKTMVPSANSWNPWFGEYWQDKFKCLLPSGTGVYPPCTGKESLQTKYTDDDADFDVYLAATMMAVDAILEGVETARRTLCLNNGGVCSHLLNPDNSGNQIYERVNQATLANVPVFDQVTGGPNPANYFYDVFNIQVNADGNNPRYRNVGTYRNGVLRITGSLEQYTSNYNLVDDNTVMSTCPSDVCCNQQPTTSPSSTTAAISTTTEDPTLGGARALLYVDAMVEITGAFPADQNRTANEFGTRFDNGSTWVIALGVLAGLGILAVLIFEIYIMTLILPNRATRQLRTMWLGQLLLLGIFLSYLTLFAFIFTPTQASCGIIRFGVGVSYAICFSVLLVKLMVILTSRSIESTIPGDIESPNYLKGAYQLLLFIFCTGVQIVIDIQWLIQIPPRAVKVVREGALADVWVCNHYTWKASVDNGMTIMSTFVRSEFENHLISLVYVMLLILITTIVALKAHGIITNHRESIFIGIAAGFSIPVWLAWTLVGGLNRNHSYAHEYGDACIAFGLFVTATLILFSMFLPKVRQLVNMGVEGIYLEDDRDTIYGSMYGGLPPPSYRSGKPGSVIYVNNPTGIYSEPVNVVDSNSLYLRHPRTHSVYSAPPATLVKRPDSNYGTGTGSKVLKVTPDLTGKFVANGRHPQSEIAYPTARSTRSEKGGTLRRARSTEQIGSL